MSRLEEDKFLESDFLFLFFLPATRVYFVIKLARATKHQVYVWPNSNVHVLVQRLLRCVRGMHHKNIHLYPDDCVLATSYTIMDIPVSLQVPVNKANS